MYLCADCVRDLDAWIAKGRELLPELGVTIARQDVVRSVGNEGANGTRTQGSAAPINIDAWQAREDLQADLAMGAQDYAKDPWSAGEVPRIIATIQRAELLVLGAPEIRVITTCECGGAVTSEKPAPEPTTENPDPEDWGQCRDCGTKVARTEGGTRDRIAENVPESLKTREALKWIKERSGITIQATDIRNWAREGKLTRTNPDDKEERPAYNVAEILAIHYRHAGANKRVPSF